MSNMSDETAELIKEYLGLHGVSIMSMFCSDLAEKGCDIALPVKGGNIWDASIRVTKEIPDGEDIDSVFYFRNTFTEIFCVDRDDDPLVFDPEILEDGMYIFQKIEEVLKSKLIVLSGMIDGKSIEEIYNENPGMFERIRSKKVEDENEGN